MPDSKVMLRSIEEDLQADIDKASAKLELFREIKAGLPPRCGTPARFISSGYCADATLIFEEPRELKALLQALPAQPVRWLIGDSHNRTFKPLASLRDTEVDEDFLRIYPVVLLGENNILGRAARWWTLVGEKRVAIEVLRATREQIPADPQKYREVYQHGTTGFLPRLTPCSTQLSALTQWRARQATGDQGGLSYEDAARHEQGQVEGIRLILRNLLAKGYVPQRDGELYNEYLRHAIEQGMGIRCELPIMDQLRWGTDSFGLRLKLDPVNRDESFYDVRIEQNRSQPLKLRDIPVTYVI